MFPESLWPRVYGAIAGVWGAATLLGPLCGGLFAEAGFWRGAFWFFVVQAVIFVGGGAGHGAAAPRERRKRDASPSVGWPADPGRRSPDRRRGRRAQRTAAACARRSVTLAAGRHAGGQRPRSDRLLPRSASDLATATGAGPDGDLLLRGRDRRLLGLWPDLHPGAAAGAEPLLSGYVIGGIAAGWTALSFVVAGLKPGYEGLAIRLGAVIILAGVAWGAFEMVRGGLVGIVLSMILLGSGFGICWAFLAKRVIGGAPAEEQPWPRPACPPPS